MKHAVLIIISLIGSVFFNSKYIDDINDVIKQILKLEDKHSSFIILILYSIIIYLIGLIIDYIGNYTYNKKLEEQKSNFESQIEKLTSENKELRKHLTQNSIVSLSLDPNDDDSINNFNKYIKNFIDNHGDYMTVNLTEIYPQSNLMRKTKENSKVNKI